MSEPHFLDAHIARPDLSVAVRALLTEWQDRDPIDCLNDTTTLRDILGPQRPLAYIVLQDPATSRGLQSAIRAWLDRDPAQAQWEVLQLYQVVTEWADSALNQLVILEASRQPPATYQ